MYIPAEEGGRSEEGESRRTTTAYPFGCSCSHFNFHRVFSLRDLNCEDLEVALIPSVGLFIHAGSLRIQIL